MQQFGPVSRPFWHGGLVTAAGQQFKSAQSVKIIGKQNYSIPALPDCLTALSTCVSLV